jgi:hypothetical protein
LANASCTFYNTGYYSLVPLGGCSAIDETESGVFDSSGYICVDTNGTDTEDQYIQYISGCEDDVCDGDSTCSSTGVAMTCDTSTGECNCDGSVDDCKLYESTSTDRDGSGGCDDYPITSSVNVVDECSEGRYYTCSGSYYYSIDYVEDDSCTTEYTPSPTATDDSTPFPTPDSTPYPTPDMTPYPTSSPTESCSETICPMSGSDNSSNIINTNVLLLFTLSFAALLSLF